MPDDDLPSRPALEKKTPATAVAGGTGSPDTPDTTTTATAASPAAPKRRAPLWIETVVLLVVALGMALIIKTFFVQAFYIPSASMEPGLVVNDRILVQKVSYWFGGSPSRGDVIVFEDPGDATPEPGDDWLTTPETGPQTFLAKGLAKVGLYPTGGHLVKRVIGTPGDTVVCCTDGHLVINGVTIDEDDFIAQQQDCDGPMVNGCVSNWKVTVPEGELFVMGDNRAASADSSDRLCTSTTVRRSGDRPDPSCDPNRAFVPFDNVVGKVFALVWPIGHAEFIGRPDVFSDVPD